MSEIYIGDVHLFAQSNAGSWIAAGAVIVVALIGAVMVAVQLRANRRLEREKIELEHQLGERADARREGAERARATEAKAAEVEDRLKREAAQAGARGRRAVEYRRKVIGRLRDLKILDMSRSLDLDRLYVQLRVREEEPLRFARDEDLAELASGEPEQMLRLSREHLRSRAAESLTPENALGRFQRIVVLGDPGAGKTTMLRYLAFRGAREELDGITFPVYVELREFIDSGETDLLGYAAGDMDRRYGFPDAGSYVEQRLADGTAVLLLDGLDEVLGGESAEAATDAYQRVAAEAARLATRYPRLTIAVTCRRAGWRGGLSQFRTLEVIDFDWPEIQEFITNWFSGAPAKAEGLRAALERNLRMQTLAANPLLLSLIAMVYERDLELPERRARLYDRCVEVMLKDWDAHRDIKRFSLFTADRKRDLLEEIAWHFHRAGLRYFPRDDLLGIVREFLPTIDIGPEDAEAILREIVAQYGLLKEQAQGWYGFLHLTLQEYFTAYAAHERGAAAVAEVARSRHDPWWEEVILLLAGRLADASPLLLRILGRDPDPPEPPAGEPLAADDDLFHGDLLLAGRCLASRPRLRASWLRDRVTGELWQILRTSPYENLRDTAADVLVEAGGPASRTELLTFIADDRANAESRSAAVDALGALGGAEVASGLLGLLDRLAGNPGVRADVITALAELRYQDAVPTLLRILWSAASNEDLPWPETWEASQCCHALAKIGGASVKEELWAILDHQVQSHGMPAFVDDLARAIGELGDSADAERLLEISDGVDHGIGFSAALKIPGPALVPRLLGVIADENSDFSRAHSAAFALRGNQVPGITDEVLRIMLDPRIHIYVREAVIPLLADDENGCRSQLLKVLDDPSVPRSIKTEVALVLAGWGDSAGLPQLRAVFEAGEQASGWILGSAAKALGKLGDYQFLPHLVDKYADSGKEISDPWRVALDRYGITKSALPLLYAPLESGAVPLTDDLLPGKIGEVADTPEDAARLLRLFLGLEEQQRDEAAALFFAIQVVSERARVRVFADGRVVPVG